jgi:hypothetical protein
MVSRTLLWLLNSQSLNAGNAMREFYTVCGLSARNFGGGASAPMSLTDKCQSLIDFANQGGVNNLQATEQEGASRIKAPA